MRFFNNLIFGFFSLAFVANASTTNAYPGYPTKTPFDGLTSKYLLKKVQMDGLGDENKLAYCEFYRDRIIVGISEKPGSTTFYRQDIPIPGTIAAQIETAFLGRGDFISTDFFPNADHDSVNYYAHSKSNMHFPLLQFGKYQPYFRNKTVAAQDLVRFMNKRCPLDN